MVSDDVPEGATTTQLHLGASYTPSGASGSPTAYRPPGRLLLSLGGRGLRAPCLPAELNLVTMGKHFPLTAYQEQGISWWPMRIPVQCTRCSLDHSGHPEGHA